MKTRPVSIEEFIKNFKIYEENDVLVNTFLGGYCYYFTIILREKFPGGKILYNPIENHFAYGFNDKIYDIRGQIPNPYFDFRHWDNYHDDELHRKHIIRDCIEHEIPDF